MANPRCGYYRLICSVLALFVSTLACSSPNDQTLYEGDDFTFSAPASYETKLYDPPYLDISTNLELVLFSNVGHYPYFSINRQPIPPGSDLETVFADYVLMITERYSYNFQYISQNTITFNERTAIESIHREFVGEPYVQTREIWMEYNGWAYSLVCVSPADGTPGAEIPVSEKCIQLAEGFKFK
jgi:hypothetical protein